MLYGLGINKHTILLFGKNSFTDKEMYIAIRHSDAIYA